jgi:hypothetical protein
MPEAEGRASHKRTIFSLFLSLFIRVRKSGVFGTRSRAKADAKGVFQQAERSFEKERRTNR